MARFLEVAHASLGVLGRVDSRNYPVRLNVARHSFLAWAFDCARPHLLSVAYVRPVAWLYLPALPQALLRRPRRLADFLSERLLPLRSSKVCGQTSLTNR